MVFRKHTFDFGYFEQIDSKEKAYWLGFIYAEGGIYKNTLSIKLANIDRYVLDEFKKSIKATYFIKPVKNKEASVIKINSKQLIEQMARLGVIPNKSAKIKWPHIPANLVPAFILGYYDGDGWITCGKEKNWLSWTIGFASISEEFINNLHNYFRDCGFGNGYYVVRKRKNKKPVYQLCYYGEVAKLVLDMLYCVNFSILRKKQLYEQLKSYLYLKYQKKFSIYKGVYFNKKHNKWWSRIQIGGKRFIIGFYDSENKAVVEYNKFIDLHPEIPSYKKNVLKEAI